MRLLAFGMLLISANALAQQYSFVRMPGAPRDIREILEDSRGGVWLGTSNDVVFFDGSRYFSLRNLGFPRNEVFSLTEDDEGAIWIASTDGVSRFSAGRLEKVVSGLATSVVVPRRDLILASVAPPGGGINDNRELICLRRKHDKWERHSLANLSYLGRLFLNHNRDVLLFPCHEGVCELEISQILNEQLGKDLETKKYSFPMPDSGRVNVLRDTFGCIWVASESSIRYQCPSDFKPNELSTEASSVLEIHEMKDGSILLASSRSLIVGRPGAFRVVTAANGLPMIAGAVPMRDGSLMLSGPELHRWAFPFRLEFWGDREGIEDAPWSTVRVGDKILTATGQGILVLSQDKKRWEKFGGGSSRDHVQFLMEGPENTVLAAMFNRGVSQFDTDGRLLRTSSPSQNPTLVLARTGDGQLWSSGANVSRVKQAANSFSMQPEKFPPPLGGAMDMGVDVSGKLWACYSGGLVKQEGADWLRLTTKDGLLENGCRSLAVQESDEVWYAYPIVHAFSLIHLSSGRRPEIQHFYDGAEIGSAQTFFFNFDRRGWLWRGAIDGIYTASIENARNGKWFHLDSKSGLPALDSNQQSFYADVDGSIWFGAERTLVHFFPPADLVRPQSAPQIFVSAFTTGNGVPQIADLVAVIPHGVPITAHIGSAEFDRQSSVRLRYRLFPSQTSFREKNGFDLDLGKVPSGNHRLEVQGRIANGIWSPITSQSFTVAKALWQTWQFMAALGGGICLFFAGGFVWRLKRSEGETFPDLEGWRLAALVPELDGVMGATLDARYEVGKMLARGGFASVFEGRDLQNDRCRCAIKVFRREVALDSKFNKGFLREIAILQQIDHPNVVSIYGHGITPNGSPFLVMEFIEGETLRDFLAAGQIDCQEIAALLTQAGEALEALHSMNIFHRDLKPENIMIRSAPDDRRN